MITAYERRARAFRREVVKFAHSAVAQWGSEKAALLVWNKKGVAAEAKGDTLIVWIGRERIEVTANA